MGSQRDGISHEKGLLQEWPEAGPRQAWLFKQCGLGYSGPAIVGDTLYLLGSRNEVEQLIAIDTQSGEERWATDLGEEFENDWGNGPRNTPTVDGDRIYTLAAKGNLTCVSTQGGKLLWQASLTELGGQIPTWGYAESPLVDGDLVLATPGGEEGAVVAFDKLTGEVRWRSTEVTDGAHYASILAAQVHGKTQCIQLFPGRLVGLDPRDGSLLWSIPWTGSVAVIPTPLFHDNQVYVTSGYGAGCMLIEISPNNETTVRYESKVMKNHHGGVIRLGDHLYGHSDKVGWVCQDFTTGKRLWRERSALGKGAIAYADGRLYCLSEDEGEVVLVEPSLDSWQERGRFTLSPQTELRKPRGKIWVHPVISGGRLYLRDQELLFSFDIKAP